MVPATNPRRRFAAWLETLESRRLMSVVTLHPSGGDDTNQIVNAIKSAHSGDTVDFQSGNYNVSSTVNFTQGINYKGESGAALNWKAGSGIQAYFTGANTNVTGLTFNGAGVLIENTNNFNFTGNSFTNITTGANYGDALFFSNINQSNITNNSFSNSSSLGIDGYNPISSHIDGNTFDYFYEPIHIYFGTHSSSNNTVSGNAIQHATRFGIELQGAPSGLTVNGNWMDNWLPHISSSGTDSHIGISDATGTANGVYAIGVRVTNNYFGSHGIPSGFQTPGGGYWDFSAMEVMGDGTVVSGNYINGWGYGAMDGNIGPSGWHFDNNILVNVARAQGSESGGSGPVSNSNNVNYTSSNAPPAPTQPNFTPSTTPPPLTTPTPPPETTPTPPPVTTPSDPSTTGSTPFKSTPFSIPGVINADNFDNGGEGVAYHWQTTSNPANGNYRPGTGVGIQYTTDSGSNDNGYNVGYIVAGDWLNYTVNVTSTRAYTLALRVSNRSSGGQFHVEVDGKNVTGAITVPNTGSWTNWQTINFSNVSLASGKHAVRVVFDTNSSNGFVGNLNWFQFS